jgi:hypothetical protein
VRWILEIIRQLHKIEDQLRQNKAAPAERERVRQINNHYRIKLLRKAIGYLLTIRILRSARALKT